MQKIIFSILALLFAVVLNAQDTICHGIVLHGRDGIDTVFFTDQKVKSAVGAWDGEPISLAVIDRAPVLAQYRTRHFPDPKPAKKTRLGSYQITRGKIVGWSLCAVGGLADGLVEGYQIDGRLSFERKYGVDRYGYWGRDSWRNVYKGGDPANGFKSPIHSWSGAFDFYHHADDLRKIGYLGGGVVIGISGAKNNPVWWHYAVDFAAAFAISAITKSAGYYYIRN